MQEIMNFQHSNSTLKAYKPKDKEHKCVVLMECLKCRRPSLNIQFFILSKGNEVIELNIKIKIKKMYNIQFTTNLLHLFYCNDNPYP